MMQKQQRETEREKLSNKETQKKEANKPTNRACKKSAAVSQGPAECEIPNGIRYYRRTMGEG